MWKTVSQTLVNCLFRGNTTKWNVRSAPWSAEHPGSHATGVPLHLCSQVLSSNWHSRRWLQHQLLPVVGSHHSLYSVSFVQDFHLNHVRTSKHNSVMVQLICSPRPLNNYGSTRRNWSFSYSLTSTTVIFQGSNQPWTIFVFFISEKTDTYMWTCLLWWEFDKKII